MFTPSSAILRTIQRRLAAFVALASFLLFASCSAIHLSYNNADIAIRWKVQEYFDLQGDQENDFKARLMGFHAWHRAEELPRYEALFHAAGERVADGVSAEDIAWATQSIRERYRLLLIRAAADAAPMLATLTTSQLDHLARQFSDVNRKFAREHLIGKEDKQRKDRLKRMRETMADWIGDLTPEQELRVAGMIRASPSLASFRLEERRQIQAQFMDIVRVQRDPRLLAARLQVLVDSIEAHRNPAYQRAIQQYESALGHMLVDLDQTLSPAQRQHVIQKFMDLSTDFRALAVKGRAPATAAVKG